MDGVRGRGRAPRRAGARRGLGRIAAAWRNGIRDGFKNRSPAGSNPAAAIFGISSDFVQWGLTGAEVSLTFTCRQYGRRANRGRPGKTGVSQMTNETVTTEAVREMIRPWLTGNAERDAQALARRFRVVGLSVSEWRRVVAETNGGAL